MSRTFPSIPDPQPSLESLYSAVRALKYTVELLTGQSGFVAASKVFVQATTPSAIASGDLWIDTSRNNKLLMWDGSDWMLVTV